ncbi:BREX system Lon protease-like protein BrxL [Methanococcus maripaludis]|uniref:ATP-dependent Lon protease n=1 Tax=Methanococcus maripaludis TaxID=39152 RepID=A0A7J9S0Y6_METMI|nr:BREX system Lon protease-like protein BrxL [Methanococcus maripaludis]MBB6067913.1 ATP-dependent Lon protease [Methanococcus maripaludis]
MNGLDIKIKNTFSEESVLKTSDNYGVFSGYNLPSFIKDWLIAKYTDQAGNVYRNDILDFLEKYIPKKHEDIKGELLVKNDEIKLLTRLLVEPDVKTGNLKFSIPDIGIKSNDGIIAPNIAKEFPELRGGESWGIITLRYVPQMGKEKGFIELSGYTPFKPYDVDIEYFKTIRKEYNISDWIDLLIRSMEYNPDYDDNEFGFTNLTKKLLFLSRLLVFVEPNLNLIELAPKGTGKSYIFGNLSKTGWMISGGTITRAKMFYDANRGTEGLVGRYDYIAIDEIQTIKFSDEMEIAGAMKSYLEQGTFTVANYKGTGQTGFILLGNIPLNENKKPTSKTYFENLPKVFKESALLDRFHGFIKGWNLPRVTEDIKVKGYALNVEYFSEIMHTLRTSGEYSVIVDDLLDIPNGADTRDVKAIKKICTGYLKLLFPHVKSSKDVDLTDFENYCLQPALEKRKIIKEQIHLIDSEFKPEIPNITLKNY